MAPPAVPLWCAALLRPGGAGAIAPFEPQAKPIYLILGAAWLCISLALAATDFQLDSSLLLPSIGLLAFGLSPFILRERGMPLAAGVAEACTLMMAVNLAGLIATLLLAATAGGGGHCPLWQWWGYRST